MGSNEMSNEIEKILTRLLVRSNVKEQYQYGEAKQVATEALASLLIEARQVERLKGQIKYLTMKARWQRMYLGGEEDAVITKRYVKSLKKQLAEKRTSKL